MSAHACVRVRACACERVSMCARTRVLGCDFLYKQDRSNILTCLQSRCMCSDAIRCMCSDAIRCMCSDAAIFLYKQDRSSISTCLQSRCMCSDAIRCICSDAVIFFVHCGERKKSHFRQSDEMSTKTVHNDPCGKQHYPRRIL
jgi:hypothetical protein